MKSNLTLIQPIEYNNLFSSYHDDTKSSKYKKYNLPKITKLFTNTSSQTNNKIFSNVKMKLKANRLNHFINEKKQLVYPLLNISTTKRSMTKTNTNLESIKYDVEKLRNIESPNLISYALYNFILKMIKDYLKKLILKGKIIFTNLKWYI